MNKSNIKTTRRKGAVIQHQNLNLATATKLFHESRKVVNRRADSIDRTLKDFRKEVATVSSQILQLIAVASQMQQRIEVLEEQVSATKRTKLRRVA